MEESGMPNVPRPVYTDEEREAQLHRARGDLRTLRVYLEEQNAFALTHLKKVESDLAAIRFLDPKAKGAS